MSVMGYVWVPLDEQAMSSEHAYDLALVDGEQAAHERGAQLLIGPPELIRFHPLTRMPAHLVWPLAYEQPVRGEQR
jgi:hypothetical protein